jgi:LemA protein
VHFPLAGPLAVTALVLGWLTIAFNRLVRYRNLVREAWSGIEVQLKRRHDLIPALVEVARGHARFERATLDEIVRLRGMGPAPQPTPELQVRENALSARLRDVLAVVEAYPELRASGSFLDLQRRLVDVENQLQMARRYYNGTVRDYSTAAESFPTNLLARLFGFGPVEFFQVESALERQTPPVSL